MAALPSTPLVTVEDYLNSAYDPDVEFVDGVLVERNVGDWLHSLVQTMARPMAEPISSSVTGTRYRLPDVCVLLAAPKTKYLMDAAFLVVEILSEGDVMSVVIEKLKEYAGKGVQNIWLIDPRLQLICMYRPPTLIEIEGGGIATADGSVELSRSEIFAE